jgi:metallophosphoesterase (TIGR00282 family)
MLIFAVGDIVSEGGLRILEKTLPAFKRLKGVGFTIVNGENAAGMGILPEHARRIYSAGADVITLGNHAFSRREILEYIENDRYLLRPENMTHFNPGKGSGVYESAGGVRVGVLCLMGRIFTEANLDSPFFTADKAIRELQVSVIAVEIHGEATSEKAAMGWYLDGRVSAVFGTHTHVQTSDERILPKGTGFITDLGMTGPTESILGMEPQSSIDRLLGVPQVRYKSAGGECQLQGALFDIDEKSGRCRSVERISLK